MSAFLGVPIITRKHTSTLHHNHHSTPICKISSPSPPNNNDYRVHQTSPSPLPPTQSISLLSRLLAHAVRAENYTLAAQIRDTLKTALQKRDPAFNLLPLLYQAVEQQDFRTATTLRDRIDNLRMHAQAEYARPKYAMGMVVKHKITGHRMLIFGVDSRKKPTPNSTNLVINDALQPWYHAAVDERDKIIGDNVIYVAQEVLEPQPYGTLVQHPITRIMFRGVYGKDICPTYSCYVPGCRIDDELEETEDEEAEMGDGAHFYNIDDKIET